MGFADVTASYVDMVTYRKYTNQTSDSDEFESVKTMMSVYLNPNTCRIPDKKYTHGLALLVAHYYALNDVVAPQKGSASSDLTKGTLTSESAGDLSKGFGGGMPSVGDVAGWKSWLLLTRYGQEFIYLMKTFKPTPLVTGRALY